MSSPGRSAQSVTLPCGEELRPSSLDLGQRELHCKCGEVHAVVMQSHPPTRFLPTALIETLRATTETADSFEEFGMAHLMGLIIETDPDIITTIDASEHGGVGYALAWITTLDAYSLHERIVTRVLDIMEHAMSHTDDETAQSQFAAEREQFDVAAFVTEYRREREFGGPSDTPV